jgi:hypothetical protein
MPVLRRLSESRSGADRELATTEIAIVESQTQR